MAFSEVFTALQQGIIDAQENPYDLIYNASLYEVQKYINETEEAFRTMVSEAVEKVLTLEQADLYRRIHEFE